MVRHVGLEMLRPQDANRLFASLVGVDRITAEPDQATAIVRSYGYLPLAIKIAGGKLAGRGRARAVLDERLTEESRRSSELHAGEPAVRASFDLPGNSPPSQRLPRPPQQPAGNCSSTSS